MATLTNADIPAGEVCRMFLMPGMRCDSPKNHAGPCTNSEED